MQSEWLFFFEQEETDRRLQMGRCKFGNLFSTQVMNVFQMFTTTGRAVRYLVPIGLNMCPPFHSISKSLRAPSIIPPARTVIEDETRRNTFWLTYATERLYSSGNGWAMSLDDQDISQLLPVRTDQFEQGVSPSFCL